MTFLSPEHVPYLLGTFDTVLAGSPALIREDRPVLLERGPDPTRETEPATVYGHGKHCGPPSGTSIQEAYLSGIFSSFFEELLRETHQECTA